MKNSTILIFIVILIIGGGYFFIQGSGSSGKAIAENEGLQKISLGLKNRNYYPNTLTVKAGVPVELTLDNSIVGCYRSFNIKSLGISEYSNNPNQKITFTIPEKGTYAFACSMGMGYGKIVAD